MSITTRIRTRSVISEVVVGVVVIIETIGRNAIAAVEIIIEIIVIIIMLRGIDSVIKISFINRDKIIIIRI